MSTEKMRNPKSHPKKKLLSKSKFGSAELTPPGSQFAALKISEDVNDRVKFDDSDDDNKYDDEDMVEVDHFDDEEDSDDGKPCGFFDDDECEICLRKKGSECTHYEYNTKWKTYNLIVCSICKSVGQHWRRNCPNLKNFKPRALSDTDPRVYAALLKLVSRKSQETQG